MKHCLKYCAVAPIILLPFLLANCYSDGVKLRLAGTNLRYGEEIVLKSFSNYLHDLSNDTFAIQSFESVSDLDTDSTYLKLIRADHDFQFFPAVLWQIHALNKQSTSKNIAEKYSEVLYQGEILDRALFFEPLLSLYLSRFLINSCERSRSLLIDILSQHISRKEGHEVDLCGGDSKICIEQLLENRALFLASELSGDPAYAQLAQQNSELVFQYYLTQGDFSELYHDLASDQPDLTSTKLEELDARDLYHLSLIFYGFSILDTQLENERYHLACVRLANLFEYILYNANSDHLQSHRSIHADRMELISKTWVCLAFNQLECVSEYDYREMAEDIFNEILDELDQPERQEKIHSSRLYYYLFEFLKQTA